MKPLFFLLDTLTEILLSPLPQIHGETQISPQVLSSDHSVHLQEILISSSPFQLSSARLSER